MSLFGRMASFINSLTEQLLPIVAAVVFFITDLILFETSNIIPVCETNLPHLFCLAKYGE